MLGVWILVFTTLPLIELALLLLVADAGLGVGGTVSLVVATGVFGAILARWQGLGIVRQVQETLTSGRIPADELLHGAAVLVGGILLLTPGILTDTIGFLLLLPPSRLLIVRMAKSRFRGRFEQVRVQFSGRGTGSREPGVKDVDARVVDPPSSASEEEGRQSD